MKSACYCEISNHLRLKYDVCFADIPISNTILSIKSDIGEVDYSQVQGADSQIYTNLNLKSIVAATSFPF